MMRWIALIAVTFSLTACQTTSGGCPPLVTYSEAFQKQAAQEMRVAKMMTPRVAQLVVDYGKMRDACRVGE